MTKPLAFSYIRFSSGEQRKGDSLNRQTAAAKSWCERKKVTLDESTTLRDLGKSAYTGSHRVNPDRHALACFLKMVEGGKVPRGSYLIVESLDRLSREHIRPALSLLLNLIESGVRIVQLLPAETVYDENVEPMSLMMAIMELNRGHSESKVKSERVGGAWREKKRLARAGETQKPTSRMGEGRKIVTRRLPSWVREQAGVLVAIPEQADAVRRIYELAIAGYGMSRIVRTLIAENFPAPGGGHWARSYIVRLLTDRRAMGEYQPQKRTTVDGKRVYVNDGDPVPNYYPPVVSEEQWLLAREGARQRKNKGTRIGKHIDLFAGLLKDARDGSSMVAITRVQSHDNRPNKGAKHRVVMSEAARSARGKVHAFPLRTLERAVLGMLREIDPKEVMGRNGGPDTVAVLSAQLQHVKTQCERIQNDLLTNPETTRLVKVLTDLEAQERRLAQELAEARAKVASPLSASWGEFLALVNAEMTDDVRIRLRAELRRIIEVGYVLVVPHGRDRIASVQLSFAGSGVHRVYNILHRPPQHNGRQRRQGRWWAFSFKLQDAGNLDLGVREQAEWFADKLAPMVLSNVEADIAAREAVGKAGWAMSGVERMDVNGVIVETLTGPVE